MIRILKPIKKGRRNTINQIALCPIMLFCFKLGNVSTIGSKVVEIIFNNIYTQKTKITRSLQLSFYTYLESLGVEIWKNITHSSEFAFDVSCLQKERRSCTSCTILIQTNNIRLSYKEERERWAHQALLFVLLITCS